MAKRGLIRDAHSAKLSADVFVLLRECDVALSEHMSRAEQGMYGEYWGKGLSWDLAAVRARLERVRNLITGDEAEKGGAAKFGIEMS